MTYRPRSTRGQTDTSFDVDHEGLPTWMLESVRAWLRPFMRSFPPHGGIHYHQEWMRRLESRMHLDPPLPWETQRTDRVAEILEERIADENGETGLDIIDYVLHHLPETHATYNRADIADEISDVLRDGGSAWEVTPVDDEGRYTLTRRAIGPVKEAIEEIRPAAERAGAHLLEAWRHLAGRSPLPDQAYFQAILAVEAAGKPVISPNDTQATLGKMKNAIRDAPQKFAFVLGEADAVVPIIEAMWETHVRHGNDDREAPMGMTGEQADAAVHLAITLVRWFASEDFRRV